MKLVLVILTVVEVIALVAALALYVIAITRRLHHISSYLGKVAFGVRAVETQTGAIGPSVLRINGTLREIEAALGPLAEKAKRAAAAR